MAIKVVRRKHDLFRKNKKSLFLPKFILVATLLSAATAYAYSEGVLTHFFK